MSDTKPIAVIAGKKQQFDDFAYWVEPADRKLFVHISRPEQLAGRKFSNVIRIGSHVLDANNEELYWRALATLPNPTPQGK